MTVHTFKQANGVGSQSGPDSDDTNDLNFATGDRRSKAIATLIAELALRGHAAHQLKDGGFLICKYGQTHFADDFDALQVFAQRVGVPQ